MSDHLTRISLQSCNYYDEKFATAETNKIPGTDGSLATIGKSSQSFISKLKW